jgi:hypothetical protein
MTSNDKSRSPKESLKQSLKEMELMHEGKIKKVAWEKFKKTLETLEMDN